MPEQTMEGTQAPSVEEAVDEEKRKLLEQSDAIAKRLKDLERQGKKPEPDNLKDQSKGFTELRHMITELQTEIKRFDVRVYIQSIAEEVTGSSNKLNLLAKGIVDIKQAVQKDKLKIVIMLLQIVSIGMLAAVLMK